MTKNENLKIYPLPETPYYKVHGRTDFSQYPLPLFWSGSAIEVNVTGSELWIDVDVDFECHEPWVCCAINGAVMSRQMLLPGSYSLCLFRGMSPDTVKNVQFVRELQAMSGDDATRILIRGFRTDGQFSPVPDRKLKLEFIGDSITSGEGTYGAKEDMDWIPMYMSASRNYATMTAQAFNAEARLLSQGGWGALCSWDNNPHYNLPAYYTRICGLAGGAVNEKLGAQKDNPFSEWQPDAIIVNLGTNDCSAFSNPGWSDPETGETFKQHLNEDGTFCAEDLARFKQAVIDFLHVLRHCNPSSYIVWTYGMLGYKLSLAITDAINTFCGETGDTKTSFLQLPNTTDETVGSHMHPGFASHIRAAKVLIEYLHELLQV